MLLKTMVGPCGLDPQTSTVSKASEHVQCGCIRLLVWAVSVEILA
jgi:hypothetical protein